MRKDFKGKLEQADAVVVARFHSETKVVASEVVDKTHTRHTLHSRFATLSVLKGAAADGFTYVPGGGYTGADAFAFRVDDGHGGVAVGTVNLTINIKREDANAPKKL